MSWHYLQGQEAASWEGTCLDGAPSALLSLLSTREECCLPGNATECCQPSRSGTMCEPSTGSRGADGLMSLAEVSPAKTLAAPGTVTDSTEKEAASGLRWPASFVKYDRDSCSWKTRQFSLLGDLDEFSETWPRWGLMRDGECLVLPMSERRTFERGSGLWPTCRVFMHKDSQVDRGKSNLGEVVGGPLNADWTEWLMGWPIEWTDLRPLATDRFRSWRQQHGGF